MKWSGPNTNPLWGLSSSPGRHGQAPRLPVPFPTGRRLRCAFLECPQLIPFLTHDLIGGVYSVVEPLEQVAVTHEFIRHYGAKLKAYIKGGKDPEASDPLGCERGSFLL
jgi:hypothetical protein